MHLVAGAAAAGVLPGRGPWASAAAPRVQVRAYRGALECLRNAVAAWNAGPPLAFVVNLGDTVDQQNEARGESMRALQVAPPTPAWGMGAGFVGSCGWTATEGQPEDTGADGRPCIGAARLLPWPPVH